MARIIAIANHKGGVGKTTTTIGLGGALAQRGKQVALVDLDTQQSLCDSLRVRPPQPGLAGVLFSRLIFGTGELQEILVHVGELAIAGGYDLTHTESQLAYYGTGWEHALKFMLEAEANAFEYILLDCKPSLGPLTVLALAAADEVLVPIQTEFLSVRQLPGIMSIVENISKTINPRLHVAGLLPTLFDIRTRHAMKILMKISTEADRYGVRLFQPVPRTIRVAEASASGLTLHEFAPRSVATLAYEALAAEIDRDADSRDVIDLPALQLRFSALVERWQGELMLESGSAAAIH